MQKAAYRGGRPAEGDDVASHRSTEDDPGLPIKLQPVSNGEFYPPAPSELALETARRTRAVADDQARRLGVSRRNFLLSAAGSATMLATLAACSSDQAAKDGATPGGTFDVGETTTSAGNVVPADPDEAAAAVSGDEFVFDVQGHFLQYPEGTDLPLPGFPQDECGATDPHDCYSAETFFDLMFDQSDTSMLVLSAIPTGGGLLTEQVMADAVATAEERCGTGRVLMQGFANPSTMSSTELGEAMATTAADFPIAAWKSYTHAGGPGWYLDDHDPDAPQVGHALLEHAVEVGPPIVAVHKGLNSVGGNPANAPYSDPVDVGPAAGAHPDVNLVIYHSGWDFGPPEGPYEARDTGVDRLITSCRDAGIGEGKNVYAELGSTWRLVMADPNAAAHTLGKLLVQFGEDRVVWGTDSIWYGSPQDQIEAFRAFQITPEFQERYGYPELTTEVKAKILGLNSARLYGVEVPEPTCRDQAATQELRQRAGTRNTTLGPISRRIIDALARSGH